MRACARVCVCVCARQRFYTCHQSMITFIVLPRILLLFYSSNSVTVYCLKSKGKGVHVDTMQTYGGIKVTAPLILHLRSRRRQVVNVTPRDRTRYPMNISPGRLQSRSGRFGEERNLIVLRFVRTNLLCFSQ